MRTLKVVLLAFAASLAPAQQPAAGNVGSSGKLSIPAQLAKTLRADKARPGDPVKFRTLEPVLVSNGIVMPANTLLIGRILNAHPKQEGKNSWLALVVERAEWKQHSLALHAFISAQITLALANNQHTSELGGLANAPSGSRASRQGARVAARSDPQLTGLVKTPQDATTTGQDELPTSHPSLENVGILRDKDGAVYLVSSKTNVKLPAGVLLMLINEPVPSPETASAKTSNGTSGSEQQP